MFQKYIIRHNRHMYGVPFGVCFKSDKKLKDIQKAEFVFYFMVNLSNNIYT